MKLNIKILLILKLFFYTSIKAVTTPTPPTPISLPASKYLKLNANNDHGFWMIEEVRGHFTDKWEVLLHLEQRWGSNYRLFWYKEYELILYYNLTEWIRQQFCICPKSLFKNLRIGAGCTQIYRIQPNTLGKVRWVGVTRSENEAHLVLEWKKWACEQRFRHEYLKYNAAHYKSHHLWRYRLLFEAPWEWTCLKINPFISTEFFFRKNTFSKSNPKGLVGGYFENRLRTGINLVILSDKLTASIWWQWRTLKQRPEIHPRWFNTYQFGANILWVF